MESLYPEEFLRVVPVRPFICEGKTLFSHNPAKAFVSFMRFQYIMTSKYILLLLSAHMFYCCILYFYSILVSSEIESVSVWSESVRSRLFCPIIQLIHVARNNVIDASTADVGIASQA